MNRYTHRFSIGVFDEFSSALEYRMSFYPNESPRDFIKQIVEEFDKVCLHPKMKQIVKELDDGRSYRRVNVWRYAFFYRIDEEQRQIVIDIIYHERSML